jgi:hypothetical protein
MLVCVLFTAVFTSLLTSRITTGALASAAAVNTLEDVRGTLCVTTAYPRLSAFVRASLAGRRDVRVVEEEVWSCAQAVLDGRAAAYVSDRSLLVWFADTYALAAPLYVSPALSVNAYALGFANGSTLRQQLNPALIATMVDPEWTPHVAEIVSRYTPAMGARDAATAAGGAGGARADAVTTVNAALVGFTLAFVGATGFAVLATKQMRRVRRARGCAPPRADGDGAGGGSGLNDAHSMRLAHSLKLARAHASAPSGAPPGAAGATGGDAATAVALADAADALRRALAAVDAAAAAQMQPPGAVP